MRGPQVHVTWPDEATLPRHHAGGPVLSLAPLQLELWLGATRCLSHAPALVHLRPSDASGPGRTALAANSAGPAESTARGGGGGSSKALSWGLWARVAAPEPHGWWWGLGGGALPPRRGLLAGVEAAEQLRRAAALLSDDVLEPLLLSRGAATGGGGGGGAPAAEEQSTQRSSVGEGGAEAEEEHVVADLVQCHAHFVQDLQLCLEQVAMCLRGAGACEAPPWTASASSLSPRPLLPPLEASAPPMPRDALRHLAADLHEHAARAELPAVAAMVRAQLAALPPPPPAAAAAAAGAPAAAPPLTSGGGGFVAALRESCLGSRCAACEARYLSWASQQLAGVQLASSGAFACMGLAANWAAIQSGEPWSNLLMLPWAVLHAALFLRQWRSRHSRRHRGAAGGGGGGVPPPPTCHVWLSVATYLARWLVEVGMGLRVLPLLDASAQQLRRGVDGVFASLLMSVAEQGQASCVLGARATLLLVAVEVAAVWRMAAQCGCTWQGPLVCLGVVAPRLLQDVRMRALMRGAARARGVGGGPGSVGGGVRGGGLGQAAAVVVEESVGRWAPVRGVGGEVRRRRPVRSDGSA